MVLGTSSMSGAYKISDLTGIKAYIDTVIDSKMSGASVFIVPDAGNQQVNIGIIEQPK